ncbi:MAG TPA: DNA polymerase III subunit delta [Anaerolineaceae bacterium]
MAESKPVLYVLYGDDDYAITKYLAAMYARLGDASTADLNYTRLDGRTASDNELRNATRSIPFLADRRVVVLTHPFARQPDGHKKAERARYQEDFIALLEGLPETTALVLVVEDQMRRGDWELLKADHWLMQWAHKAEGRALLKSFSPPSGVEMQRWVRKTAEASGGDFSLAAAGALVDLVGSDTRLATLEIDKALSYVNRARPVERADVELLTARIDQPDIFALVDAMGARDGKEASRRLHILLEEQDVLSIFGMVTRQFRLLLLTREIIDRGGGPAQVAEELKGDPFRVVPFIADKLARQAGRFTLSGLEDIFRRLLALDESFKSSQMDSTVAMDIFIAELVG